MNDKYAKEIATELKLIRKELQAINKNTKKSESVKVTRDRPKSLGVTAK